MNCCCPHSRSAARVFTRRAKRYRKRFDRKGLENSQRQLFDQIVARQIVGASVLEIGCGVGFFHQELLGAGAGTALGVDLSAAMTE